LPFYILFFIGDLTQDLFSPYSDLTQEHPID